MSRELQRVVELVRADTPPALAPAAGDAMVRAALRARPAAAPPPTTRWSTIANLALAAVALALLARPGTPRPPQLAAALTELRMSGAARVLPSAGTALSVLEDDAHGRAVALRAGSALFDIAPGGGRFQVETVDARLEVLGTVFTVTRAPTGTTVRVYEGRVAVSAAGRHAVLTAGSTWTSSGEPAATADPLAAEARTAVAARAPRVLPLPIIGPAVVPDAPAAAADADAVPAAAAAADAVPAATAAAEDPDLAEARRWLGDGRAAEVLDRARQARWDGGPPGPWWMLEGDALRALGRGDEAALAYLEAARHLRGDDAARAGYLAASVRLHDQDDADGALAALDATGADDDGSPFEERALALRVEALGRAGRADPACTVARRYLDRFPHGGHAAELAALPGCRPR